VTSLEAEPLLDVDELLSSIERVPVDRDALASTEDSHEHRAVAHGLLRETAQLVALAAGIIVGERPAWTRNEAILGGHLVRMAKLLRWVLEEIGRDRQDLLFMALRATGECIINFRYLLRHGSDELFDSYVHESLQSDFQLEDLINRNVAARGGETIPIERRMLASIERDRRTAGVTREAIPTKRIRNLGGKNVFERARDLGAESMYYPVFAGPSRMVHGGWKDLTMHHLDASDDGTFVPRMEGRTPSIQPLYALGVLTSEALEEYVHEVSHPELAPVMKRVHEVFDRLVIADALHEEFLVRRQERSSGSS
jgi:hypothetical protein